MLNTARSPLPDLTDQPAKWRMGVKPPNLAMAPVDQERHRSQRSDISTLPRRNHYCQPNAIQVCEELATKYSTPTADTGFASIDLDKHSLSLGDSPNHSRRHRVLEKRPSGWTMTLHCRNPNSGMWHQSSVKLLTPSTNPSLDTTLTCRAMSTFFDRLRPATRMAGKPDLTDDPVCV